MRRIGGPCRKILAGRVGAHNGEGRGVHARRSAQRVQRSHQARRVRAIVGFVAAKNQKPARLDAQCDLRASVSRQCRQRGYEAGGFRNVHFHQA